MQREKLNWFKGGLALGVTFLLAIILVKPIGVSTQFVIADGLLASLVNDELVVKDEAAKSGYTSSNAYLAKSGGKYAKAAANPMNYGFIFVLAMAGGAFLSYLTGGPSSKQEEAVKPPVWHQYGDQPWRRYLVAFIGGVLVLYGARLAGGCTSGHMMSGMMQTSISGYLFALGAFAVGIPAAILIYGRK